MNDKSGYNTVYGPWETNIKTDILSLVPIRENLNDYCCHVMQKVRRYTEYSMTWHLSRANMKFDENLVIFMQL